MSEDAATVERMRVRAREVADDLIGTAKSLHDVATQEEMDSPTFCAELDFLAFECDGCGWWASEDEDNDGLCDDCND